MKKAAAITAVLAVAAVAVGAAMIWVPAARGPKVHADHGHDHDHAGHEHGPNGECPLDAKNAVGVEPSTTAAPTPAAAGAAAPASASQPPAAPKP